MRGKLQSATKAQPLGSGAHSTRRIPLRRLIRRLPIAEACLIGATLLLLLVNFGINVNSRDTLRTLWDGCAFFTCTFHMLLTLQRRRLVMGGMMLFLLYGAFSPYVVNILFDISASNWRAGYEQTELFRSAVQSYLAYTLWLSLLFSVFEQRLPPPLIGSISSYNARMSIAVFAMTLIMATGLLGITATTTRADFALESDNAASLVVQLGSLSLTACFIFALIFGPKGAIRNLTLVIALAAAFISGAQGYRFVLVMFALVVSFRVLQTQRIKKKMILPITLAGLACYILLLFLAASREANLTAAQGFAAIFSGHLTISDSFAFAGAAEQINIIVLGYFKEKNLQPLLGETYLDAFIRVLPNSIHTYLANTIRAQDYILQNSNVPTYFDSRGINIGAQMYLEAFINFKNFGPYIMGSAYAVAIYNFERLKYRGGTIAYAIYFCIVSLTFSLAWYGFGNWLKQLLTMMVVVSTIYFGGNIAHKGHRGMVG